MAIEDGWISADEWDFHIGRYGYALTVGHDGTPIGDMMFPVRCRCRKIYDLAAVKVTARYADCSMWRTPCCDQQTDDRPAGWCSGPSYTELRRGRQR